MTFLKYGQAHQTGQKTPLAIIPYACTGIGDVNMDIITLGTDDLAKREMVTSALAVCTVCGCEHQHTIEMVRKRWVEQRIRWLMFEVSKNHAYAGANPEWASRIHKHREEIKHLIDEAFKDMHN